VAVPNSPGDTYSYNLQFVGQTPLGTGMTGYSIGSAFQSYHFQVDTTGSGPTARFRTTPRASTSSARARDPRRTAHERPKHLLLDRRPARAPLRARWLLASIAALACGVAAAALPLKTVEECIEAGTRSVSLPGVAGGSLSASSCTGCASLRLKFDSSTQYFVGVKAVNYAKFRQAAAKADLRLDVFYEPKTRTLTRLRIPAVAATQ
jgi:hypothetical protein